MTGLLGKDSDNNDLLMYSKWVKENKDREDLTQKVESISLSKTGEWILIKTSESLALLNAESKVGKGLWSELQKFGGVGKGLIIYPEKNKSGFDLDVIDETCTYDWDEDCLTLEWKNKAKKKSLSSLAMKGLWEKVSDSTGIQKNSKSKNVSSTKQDKEVIAGISTIDTQAPITEPSLTQE